MTADMAVLVRDLGAESEVVQQMLGGLEPADYDRATPADGWAIRDQLSHLAYFDTMEILAIAEPERFLAATDELLEHGNSFVDEIAKKYSHMPAGDLREWFTTTRTRLIAAFSALNPRTRLPWVGLEMSAASAVSARLMETWAHGQDIADTIGFVSEPTERLRHIAHLGVSSFAFSHRLHGIEVPQAAVRVELVSPAGAVWRWGPERSADSVEGSALDFCMVATQRRNLAETGLAVHGLIASRWMSIVQAYAGPPGRGREPGGFRRGQR